MNPIPAGPSPNRLESDVVAVKSFNSLVETTNLIGYDQSNRTFVRVDQPKDGMTAKAAGMAASLAGWIPGLSETKGRLERISYGVTSNDILRELRQICDEIGKDLDEADSLKKTEDHKDTIINLKKQIDLFLTDGQGIKKFSIFNKQRADNPAGSFTTLASRVTGGAEHAQSVGEFTDEVIRKFESLKQRMNDIIKDRWGENSANVKSSAAAAAQASMVEEPESVYDAESVEEEDPEEEMTTKEKEFFEALKNNKSDIGVNILREKLSDDVKKVILFACAAYSDAANAAYFETALFDKIREEIPTLEKENTGFMRTFNEWAKKNENSIVLYELAENSFRMLKLAQMQGRGQI